MGIWVDIGNNGGDTCNHYIMLDILTVTYNQEKELPCFLHSLNCQTRRDFRVVVMHDGIPVDTDKFWMMGSDTELKIERALLSDRRNDWGHTLRATMLSMYLENPYVLLTNADNYYMPRFVEYMLKRFEDDKEVGVVYCNAVHSHPHPNNNPSHMDYGVFQANFAPCQCDIGEIIVRSDIARAVGFKHRHRDADASWIQDILDYQKEHYFKIVKESRTLFVHN